MKAMLALALGAALSAQGDSLFGPNVHVFSPEDEIGDIERVTGEIFRRQHHRQFGPERHAFLFKPGDYSRMKPLEVGYYTQVLGLGRSPLDVKLNNVKTPAALPNNNVTCNFWVGIENLDIVDTDGNDDPFFNFQWAVSQAAPARRLYVERKAVFDWFYGWASGGYVADSIFKKPAGSYPQQQYYFRNNRFEGGTYGINWNQVLQGCVGDFSKSKDSAGKPFASAKPLSVPSVGKSTWADGGSLTMVAESELIREKPYLVYDGACGRYQVIVPPWRRHAKGPSWDEGNPGAGAALDLEEKFHIARADRDDAASINRALAAGKNVLFTPGIYRLAEPLRVTKPDTVLLGIGEATLVPMNDDAALRCADADGLVIAGLIFDAVRHSNRFVVMGEGKTSVRHTGNPAILQDLVYRVGGTGEPGQTDVCLEIDSNDVVIDHTWVWRADHGEHTGWTANVSKNGIVVNGNGVTGYGLFVEHFEEYDVLWNGEDGHTYFLQNEKCYDPPDNGVWSSHGGKKPGWAGYKVADNVKRHYAVGLGIYDVLINTNGKSVFMEDAVEVPDTPGVTVDNACIVELSNGEGPIVGFNHIVNGRGHGIRTGKNSGGGFAVQRVAHYCNGEAVVLPDAYRKKK